MVKIVGRRTWGARRAAGSRVSLPALEAWLHHTAALLPNADNDPSDEYRVMRQLEEIAFERFGTTVSYTFVPMPRGVAYEGHPIGTRGSHTKGRNSIAIGIALPGNYMDRAPTAAQIEQTGVLLVDLYRAKKLKEPRLNGGHRQVPGAATLCPGDKGVEAVPKINAAAKRALAAGPGPRRTPVQVVRQSRKPKVDLPHVLLSYRHGIPPAGTDALRGFQRALGQTPDGVPGPKTRAAYVRAVKAVQKAVGARRTGRWDRQTNHALRAMQGRLGIVPDGIYGPATEAALEKHLSA